MPKAKVKKRSIEADNARQARQRIKELGLMPVEMTEAKAKTAKGAQPIDLSLNAVLVHLIWL